MQAPEGWLNAEVRGEAQLATETAPVPWLGANFWSRAGGPLMWRALRPRPSSARNWTSWRPRAQRDPVVLLLARLRARARTGSTRTPRRAFADFLDAHPSSGSTTVPTFIVGHMSGENWDPAWRQGRDLYPTSGWSPGRRGSPPRSARRFARPPRHRRLADHQRDADLRRAGDDRGGRRAGPASWSRPCAPAGAQAAGLPRRRRLGRRGQRRGQRLLAARRSRR